MKNQANTNSVTWWRLLPVALVTAFIAITPRIVAAQTATPEVSPPKTAHEFIKVMGELYRGEEGTKDLQNVSKRLGVSFVLVEPKNDRSKNNSVHAVQNLPPNIKLLEWRVSVLEGEGVRYPQDSIGLTLNLNASALCLRIEDVRAASGLHLPLPHPRASSHTRIENAKVWYQSYLSRDLQPLRNIVVNADFDEQRCLRNLNLNERIFHQGEKK